MSSYYWYDLFHTSTNERKRDEYKKAVNRLTTHKEKLYENIKACENSFDNFKFVYSDSSEISGDVIDNFFNKSEDLDRKVQDYISRLWTAYNEVCNRLSRAQELYDSYYEACVIEDQENERKWEENGW